MARIIFMGTPEYACRILERIWSPDDEWLVVTKPDMPVGRRQVMTPSTVAVWAEEHHLTVVKPVRLKDYSKPWTDFQPDWILTAAYGRILQPWVLQLPRWGALNLHASLLPRWRGANPIAWAIRSGDAMTGVTLMAMDSGVDTGAIVATAETPILPQDTTGTLTDRLAEVAAGLWVSTREKWGEGPWPSYPQPHQGVTMAPKFEPQAGHLDWQKSARELDAWVRSMTPEPGAYTMLDNLRIKILRAEALEALVDSEPGLAVLSQDQWRVATGAGTLLVSQIHPAGRRPMSPGEFVRGRRGEALWTLH